MVFTPAKKVKAKLRLCLIGPAGTGKTKSALRIMEHLMGEGEKFALIDTEHASAAKYGKEHEFDHASLTDHSPAEYSKMIKEAEAAGYSGLVIDSLSHAWMGTGGALEMVEAASAQMRTGNSYSAWGKVTPVLRQLIETILGSSMHIIVTLRSKMEYVQEKDDRGKTVIRKVGMQPVMRDGIEYEFDLVGDLNQEHQLVITKSRCGALDGKIVDKPGPEIAGALLAWLSDGDELPEPEPEAPPVDENHNKAEFAAFRTEMIRSAAEIGKTFGTDKESADWFNNHAKTACVSMGFKAGHIPQLQPDLLEKLKQNILDLITEDISPKPEAANA